VLNYYSPQAGSGQNLLDTCGAIKERRTAFSAPNKELSAKPKEQSQINCPARAKSPLTGESPVQVACEPDPLAREDARPPGPDRDISVARAIEIRVELLVIEKEGNRLCFDSPLK